MKKSALKFAKSTATAAAIVAMTGALTAPSVRAAIAPPGNDDASVQLLNDAINTVKPGYNLFTAANGDLKKAVIQAVASHALTADNAVAVMRVLATTRGSAAGDCAGQMITSLANYDLADDIAAAAAQGAPKYAAVIATKTITSIVLAAPADASVITGAVIAQAPDYSGAILKSAIAAVKSKAADQTDEIVTAALSVSGIDAAATLKGGVSGNTAALNLQASAAFAADPTKVAEYSAALLAGKIDGTLKDVIVAQVNLSSATNKADAIAGLNAMVDVKLAGSAAVTAAQGDINAASTASKVIAVVRGAAYANAGKAGDITNLGVTKLNGLGAVSQATGLVTAATQAAPNSAKLIAEQAIKVGAVVTGGYADDVIAAAAAASPAKSGDVIKQVLKSKNSSGVLILDNATAKAAIAAVVTAVPNRASEIGFGITGGGATDAVDADLGNSALQVLDGIDKSEEGALAAALFSSKKLLTTGTATFLKTGLSDKGASIVQYAFNTVTQLVAVDGTSAKKPSAQIAGLIASGTDAETRLAIAKAGLVCTKDGVAMMSAAIAADYATDGSANAAEIYKKAYQLFATSAGKIPSYVQAYAMLGDVLTATSGNVDTTINGLDNIVYLRARLADNATIAGDLTTAASYASWKGASQIVRGAVMGSPKQGKAIIAAALRSTLINLHSSQFTGADYTYTSDTTGFSATTDHQARVAAALVGTAVDAVANSGVLSKSTDIATQIKNIVSGGVKEALRDVTDSNKDVIAAEGQQVRGATAGAVLGINTDLNSTDAQTLLVLIATEASKAGKQYGRDIANAMGVVLGYRQDVEANVPGSSPRADAILAAISANSGIGGEALRTAFYAGYDLGNSERTVQTNGSLAAFVRLHTAGSGHTPVNLPVTDIAGE